DVGRGPVGRRILQLANEMQTGMERVADVPADALGAFADDKDVSAGFTFQDPCSGRNEIMFAARAVFFSSCYAQQDNLVVRDSHLAPHALPLRGGRMISQWNG